MSMEIQRGSPGHRPIFRLLLEQVYDPSLLQVLGSCPRYACKATFECSYTVAAHGAIAYLHTTSWLHSLPTAVCARRLLLFSQRLGGGCHDRILLPCMQKEGGGTREENTLPTSRTTTTDS